MCCQKTWDKLVKPVTDSANITEIAANMTIVFCIVGDYTMRAYVFNVI